ncbi:hypothetical protein B0H13DRAFT_1888833 [Mycena leptocephala]|nr:hypothetical protein B0H13DRAFT_1888833 [Mycena leptocephala]
MIEPRKPLGAASLSRNCASTIRHASTSARTRMTTRRVDSKRSWTKRDLNFCGSEPRSTISPRTMTPLRHTTSASYPRVNMSILVGKLASIHTHGSKWYLHEFRAMIPLYNVNEVPAGFSILASTHMICGYYTHGSESGFFLPRGVADNMFCVIDPVGGNIPISLRYCHLYSDLDRIIKAYLENRQEAGSIISPMEFAETVKAGMQVEMNIIKRTFHAWRERRVQSNNSAISRKTAKASEWFICANPACGRKYEINENNGEIVSPEVAQDRSGQESLQPEVFRLVQDYTVQVKGPVQVKGRQGFITQLNNSTPPFGSHKSLRSDFQARQASHTVSWTELSTGPAQEITWTVQLKGVSNSKAEAKNEAARQALNLMVYGNWQKETCDCSEFYLEKN